MVGRLVVSRKIARDFYVIFVSIVALESIFIDNRLVSASRRGFYPTMVETLTCAQNWLLN